MENWDDENDDYILKKEKIQYNLLKGTPINKKKMDAEITWEEDKTWMYFCNKRLKYPKS